jgi:hypothetical protein
VSKAEGIGAWVENTRRQIPGGLGGKRGALIALIVDASPGVQPSSAQGLRGPIGASTAVSRVMTASVVVRITIVHISGTDMPRIITAVVVVWPIIGEIARSYGQVRPWAATTMLDLNHINPGAFAGVQKGLPDPCGIGHGGKAP